jgi:hypothetical protein
LHSSLSIYTPKTVSVANFGDMAKNRLLSGLIAYQLETTARISSTKLQKRLNLAEFQQNWQH